MFIGPKEIQSTELVPEKHRGTIQLVKVNYTDKTSEIMTEKLFEVSKTEESKDFTTLREERIHPIVKEALEMFLSYGFKVEDTQFFIASLTQSINHSIMGAASKLWGKDSNTIDFLDIDKVLLSIDKEKVTVDDILKEN